MRFRLKIGLACLLLAAVLWSFVPIVPRLSVTNTRTGQVLLCQSIKPGDTFKISYIHSVNKSKVIDSFIISKDYEIYVTETAFSAYGAGIPEPEGNQYLVMDKDAVHIKNLNRKVNPYRLFVGVTADHTIILHDETIHFTDLTPPQTSLVIRCNRMSGWKVLLFKFQSLFPQQCLPEEK